MPGDDERADSRLSALTRAISQRMSSMVLTSYDTINTLPRVYKNHIIFIPKINSYI